MTPEPYRWMETRWTAPGEGCLLIDLILAATTIDTAQVLNRDERDTLRELREWLDERGRGAEFVNLKLERCELLIDDVRGEPDRIDALRITEVLRRLRARQEREE